MWGSQLGSLWGKYNCSLFCKDLQPEPSHGQVSLQPPVYLAPKFLEGFEDVFEVLNSSESFAELCLFSY